MRFNTTHLTYISDPCVNFGVISLTGSRITIYGNFTKSAQLPALREPILAYMSSRDIHGTLLLPCAKFQVIWMTMKCNIMVLCCMWIVSDRNSTWNSAVLTANWMDLECFLNSSVNIEWNDLKFYSHIVIYYFYKWKQSPVELSYWVELGEGKILVMWCKQKVLWLGWKFEGVAQIVTGYSVQKMRVMRGVEVP